MSAVRHLFALLCCAYVVYRLFILSQVIPKELYDPVIYSDYSQDLAFPSRDRGSFLIQPQPLPVEPNDPFYTKALAVYMDVSIPRGREIKNLADYEALFNEAGVKTRRIGKTDLRGKRFKFGLFQVKDGSFHLILRGTNQNDRFIILNPAEGEWHFEKSDLERAAKSDVLLIR